MLKLMPHEVTEAQSAHVGIYTRPYLGLGLIYDLLETLRPLHGVALQSALRLYAAEVGTPGRLYVPLIQVYTLVKHMQVIIAWQRLHGEGHTLLTHEPQREPRVV